MERLFRRDFGALESIFEFVSQFFAACGIEARHAFEVEFIIEELFTNLVKYNRGRHDIEIRLGRVGDEIEIVLTDVDVEPFDITQVPEVDTEKPLSDRKVGGLGLHLVRKMADRVAYEYANRRSTITVTKRLGS